jgi:hypothetical protein
MHSFFPGVKLSPSPLLHRTQDFGLLYDANNANERRKVDEEMWLSSQFFEMTDKDGQHWAPPLEEGNSKNALAGVNGVKRNERMMTVASSWCSL